MILRSTYLTTILTLSILLTYSILLTRIANGQTRHGPVAVGAQIGSPSGISVNIASSERFRYDFQAAWDIRYFFFINGHILFHTDLLINDREVRLYYGPGAYVGYRSVDDAQVITGISSLGGMGKTLGRFEAFVQFSPRLDLVPATRARIGGGIGIRYYFGP